MHKTTILMNIFAAKVAPLTRFIFFYSSARNGWDAWKQGWEAPCGKGMFNMLCRYELPSWNKVERCEFRC